MTEKEEREALMLTIALIDIELHPLQEKRKRLIKRIKQIDKGQNKPQAWEGKTN